MNMMNIGNQSGLFESLIISPSVQSYLLVGLACVQSQLKLHFLDRFVGLSAFMEWNCGVVILCLELGLYSFDTFANLTRQLHSSNTIVLLGYRQLCQTLGL